MRTARPTDHCGACGSTYFQRADLVLRIAQFGDEELPSQRRQPRQFALGGGQRRARQRGDGPGGPGEGKLLAQPQGRGLRRRLARVGLEGHDEAAVVLRQPAALAAVEQRMPFVPTALGIAQLQPPDDGEGVAREAPGGAQLQRRVVLDQLGRSADLAQRLALAQQRAAAEAADGAGRCGRGELDRRAAVGAQRLPAALRGCQRPRPAVIRPASSAARSSSRRIPRRSGCPWSSGRRGARAGP